MTAVGSVFLKVYLIFSWWPLGIGYLIFSRRLSEIFAINFMVCHLQQLYIIYIVLWRIDTAK